MSKGKVVDMFSKKPMDEEKQNTKLNDYLVENKGRYVGSITKEHAEHLRDSLKLLNGRREQITKLMLEWEEDYNDHMAEIFDMLAGDLRLKQEDFDPISEDVFIDEKGSVFVVLRPEEVDPNKIH